MLSSNEGASRAKCTQLWKKLLVPLFQMCGGCWQKVGIAECPALYLTCQPACTNQLGNISCVTATTEVQIHRNLLYSLLEILRSSQ